MCKKYDCKKNITLEILEKLKNENISVSLTLSGSALNSSALDFLENIKIKGLFIYASSLDELQSFVNGRVEEIYTVKSYVLGFSFNVNSSNYKDLSDVLSFCLKNEINYLVIPMQRLMSENDCFYLSKTEQAELTSKLNSINYEKMQITIHDPFLWRVLYPLKQFPDSGCQAANSMVYISHEGDVYPCPSMPIKLGNLIEENLKDIVLSSKKKDLRSILSSTPKECLDCDELAKCLGGCRGRAHFLSNSFDKPDPACM